MEVSCQIKLSSTPHTSFHTRVSATQVLIHLTSSPYTLLASPNTYVPVTQYLLLLLPRITQSLRYHRFQSLTRTRSAFQFHPLRTSRLSRTLMLLQYLCAAHSFNGCNKFNIFWFLFRLFVRVMVPCSVEW